MPAFRIGLQFLARVGEIAEIADHFRIRPVHRANKLASNRSIAVDDKRLRVAGCPIKPAALGSRGIAHGQKIDIVVAQEPDVLVFVFIEAHSQYGQAAVHASLHLNQRRHFFHAWSAVGRPEIQHHRLAAQFVESDSTRRILNCEIRSRRANQSWMRSAIASRKQSKEYTGEK